MPAVRWLVRRLAGVAWIAGIAGALDAVLLATAVPLVGAVVAIVTIATVGALLWQRHLLGDVVQAEPEIRAELQLLGDLPGEAGRLVTEAVAELERGSVLHRLRGAKRLAGVVQEHPLAQRAAALRAAFLGRPLVLTGWALAVTGVLVLGLPVAAGIAAVAAFV
jgi:hypothetical protein